MNAFKSDRLLIIISIIIGSSVSVPAQAPDIFWAKTFGGSDYDYGNAVRQTADGGFIIAGSTKSSGAGDRDAWLIRTDSAGNALWSKTIGGLELDEVYSVWQNSDGGFIAAGQIRSGIADSIDILYFRTDSNGNLIWIKNYGGPGVQFGRSVQQTSDGGFIIAGYTSDSLNHADAVLLLTDSSGKEIQYKIFDRGEYDYAHSVLQTATGGYTFCGSSAGSDIMYDAWMVSTDPSLNLLNDKVYGGPLSEYGQSLKQTSDGGYIIAGSTYSYGSGNSDFWLIRTNSSGDTLWTRAFGGTENELGYSVDLTDDGGFIAAGYTSSFGNGSQDMWLIRTDSFGDTLWTKTIGGTSTDEGKSVRCINDDEFIVCGNTLSYGSGETDVWLIRLNSSASVPVELTSFTATATGTTVELNWITAAETNNRGFEVERSQSSKVKNQKWETLAFVDGHGTTTNSHAYSFIDKNITAGSYLYRLKQIDFEGTYEYSPEVEVEILSPNEFYLSQNYPNPFNPNTKITWRTPVSSWQTLKIYDVLGNELKTLVDEYKPAGNYEVEFEAAHLPSGVYFYQLQAGEFIQTKRLMLLK